MYVCAHVFDKIISKQCASDYKLTIVKYVVKSSQQ